MTSIQLKKRIDAGINHLNEQQLAAVLKMIELLNEGNVEHYTLAEAEWKETERNHQEIVSGKIQPVNARMAIEKLKADLKKKGK